jgi:hypothetical protein|uniref:Methyltransferase n=1 Tax=viral metagenome TaxID=1070528 RepID=A0A6C0IMW9_9ZZZZ
MYSKFMPISFDLKKEKEAHNCVNYFETGLWDARALVSSKQALSAGFEKVFCIELREKWITIGNDVFKEEIENNKYHLYHDDSVHMTKYLENNPDFDKKTMFFLDAHVDNQNIENYTKICPVIDELLAIKSLTRKDHVIMVDDLRLLKQPYPWGETGYGALNFMEAIMQIIKEINPEYQFKTLPGHIEDDVLCAYIQLNN